MKQLRKYWSLYCAIFRTSAIAELEFRLNYVTRIFADVLWYVTQAFTFEVLYYHTDTIGAWNREQTRVFLGIIFFVDAIYMILFHDNLEKFSDKVRKGELDLLLAKPVNSQFMVSFQRAATAHFGNLLLAALWLGYAVSQLPELHLARLLWLLLFVPAGVIVIYCCRFIAASTAVIFTRSENLQFIWYQLYKLGMRPDSIYVPWIRVILLTVLPVAVIASVPARAVLEPPNMLMVLWIVILCPTLLWITSIHWNRCLRHYSSASS